jgi:flagellin-specific chaperone FliS
MRIKSGKNNNNNNNYKKKNKKIYRLSKIIEGYNNLLKGNATQSK